MKNYTFILFLVYLFSQIAPSNEILAQEIVPPKSYINVPPSPTAAGLAKYGDIPVSLYTGTPSIEIPLHVVSGRTLSLPITLKYHASGIKVEETAGWVGLGWALDAGGVISRSVRGIPDDYQMKGYIDTAPQLDAELALPKVSLDYILKVLGGQADSEPDDYFYSFNGLSGRLIVGPNEVVRTIPQTNLNIDISRSNKSILDGGAYQISEWIVTADDGTKYYFDADEHTYKQTGESIGLYYISAWHLTKIESSTGSDIIELSYYDHHTTYYQTQEHRESLEFGNCVLSLIPDYDTPNRQVEYGQRRLKEITSAKEKIVFNSPTKRDDARSYMDNTKQEYQLDNIEVYKKTASGWTLNNKINFSYTYFGTAAISKRLKLDSVQHEGLSGEKSPPYRFTYNEQYQFPDRLSKAIDHWGYYNGAANNIVLYQQETFAPATGANRNPNATYANLGMLHKITYPTGGFTELTYEPHDYGRTGHSETVYYTTINKNADVWATYVPGGPDPAESMTQFVIRSDDKYLRLVYLNVYFDLEYAGVDDWVEIRDSTHAIYNNHTFTENHSGYIVLPAGKYYLYARARSHQGDKKVKAVVTWQDVIKSTGTGGGNWPITGGVRVKKQVSNDGYGNNYIREYRYRFESDPSRSSGILLTEPRYYYIEEMYGCFFISRSSTSIVAPGVTQGSHIAYREVQVLHGTNGQYGKMVHTFTSPIEFPDDDPTISDYTWPFSSRTTYDWKRGKPHETRVLDNEGQTLQKTSHQYRFKDTQAPSDHISTQKYNALTIGTGPRFYQSIHPVPFDKVTYHPYKVISSWWHPVSESTVWYNSNGQPTVTTGKEYEYASNVHKLLTKLTETNTGGQQKRITEYVYAHQQSDPMRDRNMLSQLRSLTVKDGANTYLSKQWVTWSSSIPGAIGTWLPREQWIWTGSGTPPGNPSVSTAIKTMEIIMYDVYGNPLRVRDANNGETRLFYGSLTQPFSQNGINGVQGAYLTGIQKVIGSVDAISGGVRPSSGDDLFTEVRYDTRGRVTREIDENVKDTWYEYDNLHRLSAIRNHSNQLLTQVNYIYSATSGNGWTFQPNGPNYIETIEFSGTTAGDRISRVYYDGLGRPIQSQLRVNASDVIVQHTFYDVNGREEAITRPITTSNTGLAYITKNSLMGSSWSPGGGIVMGSGFQYSGSNAEIGFDAEYSYSQTSYYADPLGRVAKQVPPGLTYRMSGVPERTVRFEYGFNSASVESFSALGYAMNRLHKRTVIDENGDRLWEYTDGWGRTIAQVVDFGKSSVGVVSSHDIFTGFEYDLLDRLVKVHEPRGWSTTNFKRVYNYDRLGRLTSETSPDLNGSIEYLYDRAGNLRLKKDAKGVITYYLYDDLHRLIEVGKYLGSSSNFNQANANSTNFPSYLPDREISRDYSYDSPTFTGAINVKGRPARARAYRNGVHFLTSHYSYNNDGNVSWMRHQYEGMSGIKRVEYLYDRQGRVTRKGIVDEGNTSLKLYTHYEYDRGGRLQKVLTNLTGGSTNKNTEAEYSYFASGQVKQLKLGHNTVETLDYAYNARNWLTGINNVNTPGSRRFAQSLHYDQTALGSSPWFNGNIGATRIYNAAVGAQPRIGYRFNYDRSNRLTLAQTYHTSSWTETDNFKVDSLKYDKSGNITRLRRYNQSGGVMDNFTYNYQTNTNRLISIPGYSTYLYDNNGNMTKDTARDILNTEYDIHNMPLAMHRDLSIIQYWYDANGNRVRKDASGANQVYVRGADGQTEVVYNWNGSVRFWNIIANGEIIGRVEP
jgi:YD repeat-containing protein